MPKSSIYLLLIALIIAGWWSFSNLEVSEDIDTAIPNAKAFSKIKPLLDKGKRSVVFSMAINVNEDTPFLIANNADSLIALLTENTGNYIGDLQYKSDIDPDTFSLFFFNHLYLFLDSSDYLEIEKDIRTYSIAKTMSANKSALYTPEGLALKDWTTKDPLHLSRYAYKKLQKDVVADGGK